MITLVAKLTAQAGKEDELRSALEEMVGSVGANEPGVVTYSLHVADDDPTVFLFYEQYSSPEALEAHGTTDHMKAFGARLGGLLGGAMDIGRYTQITGVDR